ncbi:MAG: hypothetical protein U0270_04415 [Labilithrix sp.]|mgnify:FL=1
MSTRLLVVLIALTGLVVLGVSCSLYQSRQQAARLAKLQEEERRALDEQRRLRDEDLRQYDGSAPRYLEGLSRRAPRDAGAACDCLLGDPLCACP